MMTQPEAPSPPLTYEQIILSVWPHAYSLLEPAIELTEGLHDGRSVLNLILRREAELFMSVKSAIVVEIIDYPYGRACHFFLAGGDLDELKSMEPEIVAWGQTRGCTHNTISGRRGWLRALDGYRETATAMVKRNPT